jgi:O-antigen ligase
MTRISIGRRLEWDEPIPKFRHGALILAISMIWSVSLLVGFQFGLLLVSLLALSIAIAGLKRSFIGMLGIGMLATLDPLSRGLLADEGIWRWNTFNYLLISIAIFSANSIFKKATLQHWVLLLFVSLLALELAITEDFGNGVQQLLGAVSAFGFVAYLIKVERLPGIWYSLGIVNGFLGALAGLSYYLQDNGLPYLNPNALVHSPLAALASICLAFLEARTARQTQKLVILAGLNMILVFLSGSRGGLLVGALSILYILACAKSIAGLKSIRALFLVSAAAALFIGPFSDLGRNASSRVMKLFDSERSIDNKTSGRSDIAFAGWQIFKDHPLGVGTGGFDQAFAELDIEGLAFAGHQKQAHSAWVKILAENGIPGIALLLLFVGSFATGGVRMRKQGLAGLGFLAAASLAVGFLSTEFQSKDLWLVAMSTAAVFHLRAPAGEPYDTPASCRNRQRVEFAGI